MTEEREFGRIAALAALAAGLVAYLYLLGGTVTWLRLAGAQLAGDAGIVATDSKRLLAIGARVVVFEILLLIAISAIVTALVMAATFRRGKLPEGRQPREFADFRDGWSKLWTLGGMIGPASALLLIVIGASVETQGLRCALLAAGIAIGAYAGVVMVRGIPPEGSGPDWAPWWLRPVRKAGRAIRGGEAASAERRQQGIGRVRSVATTMLVLNVVVAVCVVSLLHGAILLAGTALIYAGPFVTWPRSSELKKFTTELVRSSGVWLAIGSATLIALAWMATPPVGYPLARVQVEGLPVIRPAAYIDRTSDGVYVGYCTPESYERDGEPGFRSSASLIVFVAKDTFRGIEVGSATYEFDPGGRPSLFQVIAAGLEGESAARADAPLSQTTRPRSNDVCDFVDGDPRRDRRTKRRERRQERTMHRD